LEIRQSFAIPFAPDQVWRCFHDIESIVGCLLGAGLTEPPRGGKLALSMTVKLDPIVTNFARQGEGSTLPQQAYSSWLEIAFTIVNM
jgi:carbon monoxide dehydrogenase subunit G